MEATEDAPSLDTALADVSNKVYAAACYIENLEHHGVASGNGHHAAQNIAALAQYSVLCRWIDREAVWRRTWDRHFGNQRQLLLDRLAVRDHVLELDTSVDFDDLPEDSQKELGVALDIAIYDLSKISSDSLPHKI